MPTDRTHRKAWPQATLLALAVLAAVAIQAPTRPALAQEPKPAKKDSNPRFKPKDTVLTAEVSPAEAQPGESVKLKITAKLDPGYHIWAWAKTQEDGGPRNTSFDVFDLGGLSLVGDWTASKEPTRKKDTAFPDVKEVAYFEDEVTWSLDLKVPDDAKPGPRTIRVQASYMTCNAKSCSIYGGWTLPPATLTILSAKQTGHAASNPKPATRHPSKPETSSQLVASVARLSVSAEPEDVKLGQTFSYRVTMTLDPGYHVYAYAKERAGDGPLATQFDFFDHADFIPDGDWTPSTAPMVKTEAALNNQVTVYHENEVTWTLALKVPDDAKPGKQRLRSQIDYQVCNENSCLPPVRVNLPDLFVAVLDAKYEPPASSTTAAATATMTPSPASPVGRRPLTSNTPQISPSGDSTASVAAEPPKVVSDVEKTAQQGIIPLMIASALGGLLALVMPCVWPMVPITVNFFLKQGQKGSGKTTALAITYCLAIIGVFTTVGVLCSFFVSAAALPKLATNPWLNFGVAALFIAFGLSLLGLFEIRLPNFLLNASAQGESKGGLIGVIFMALTLTITSFTCTFPVVGGLLVMASAGQFFYPIVGLATFSAVLALPFFLLALAPGMLSKMPKSGDWMNAVKVVGGLVEIAAAFKFLNQAETAFVTPENAWFDAQVVLTIWVVLASICGIYLLGLFRTDHDHEEVKIGPGRMIFGAVFLGLALFMAPALFGRPPQSVIWGRIVMPMLPPDAGDLEVKPTALAVGGSTPREQHATATDPEDAQRQETKFHGVSWGLSFDAAFERAKAEKKPVLVDFTGQSGVRTAG